MPITAQVRVSQEGEAEILLARVSTPATVGDGLLDALVAPYKRYAVGQGREKLGNSLEKRKRDSEKAAGRRKVGRRRVEGRRKARENEAAVSQTKGLALRLI